MAFEPKDGHWDRDWWPYVSAAQKRQKALQELEKRKKKGQPVSPVVIEGRDIVKTFWGKAWSQNLERYSDFANRLPRGRAYVRNGSVIDLQIATGVIDALVSGTHLYDVKVKVKPVAAARWKSICKDCSGAIDSLIELLQGKLSSAVMDRICREETGLFPSPAEIELSCSCPDAAYLCKHIAAVLYGIGARFDESPELLFRLRDVDQAELIAKAGEGFTQSKKKPAASKVLVSDDLSGIFGLDIASGAEFETSVPEPATKAGKPKRAAKKPVKGKSKVSRHSGKPAERPRSGRRSRSC